MKTVAVMQPYFVPYAGYFRLFAAADLFVAFDCVQFPRRGWVHRNRFDTANGEPEWLTLAIRKCPRNTAINDLIFAAGATADLVHSLQRFPLLKNAWQQSSPVLGSVLRLQENSVAAYLCEQLAVFAKLLGVSRPIVRSSSLNIAANLHGQARVIAIAQAVGAKRYVNSPGGRTLYEASVFEEHGMELRFLTPYKASTNSILSCLLSNPANEVADVVRSETILVP